MKEHSKHDEIVLNSDSQCTQCVVYISTIDECLPLLPLVFSFNHKFCSFFILILFRLLLQLQFTHRHTLMAQLQLNSRVCFIRWNCVLFVASVGYFSIYISFRYSILRFGFLFSHTGALVGPTAESVFVFLRTFCLSIICLSHSSLLFAIWQFDSYTQWTCVYCARFTHWNIVQLFVSSHIVLSC